MPSGVNYLTRGLRLLLLTAIVVALHLGTVSQASAAKDGNPCALLTAQEVESVLGQAVVGAPFRADGTQASATGATCRYEAKSFRSIGITVDWSNGGDAFKLMGMVANIADAIPGVLTLADGTTVQGAWDQAALFLCCEFNVLRGDQRIMIDVSNSAATAQQAAQLADLALQRLDEPLAIESGAGVADAMVRSAARPAIRSACDLVTRAEAEALLGRPLAAEPEGADTGCSYQWQPEGADYVEEIRLLVTWRGGFGELRLAQSAIGGEPDGSAEAVPAPFDAYFVSIIGVMAVRKDVLLSIESGPMSDMAAQFIAIAGTKL